MDSQKARHVLKLYRPGTTDAMDPQMAEALQAVQADPELARWFNEHCGVYIAIRSKLKQIQVPADLKRRILAEHLVRKRVVPFPNLSVWLAAAAVVILVAIGAWRFLRPSTPAPVFAEYRNWAVSEAQRNYTMTLRGNNFAALNAFLATKQCPTNYDVPQAVQKLALLGCADGDWKGYRYSLVCYDTGKPPPPSHGGVNDLWLFVARRSDFAAASLPGADPLFIKILHRNTLSWTSGDNVYILAGLGDEPELRQYAQND